MLTVNIHNLLTLFHIQRNIHNAKPTMSTTTKANLRRLNWPDFLLHEAILELRRRKIEFYSSEFGTGTIEAVAAQIKKKSEELSAECINSTKVPNNMEKAEMTLRTAVLLRDDKINNITCKRLQFQGPFTSRFFQVREFDRIFE